MSECVTPLANNRQGGRGLYTIKPQILDYHAHKLLISIVNQLGPAALVD
jgi:hypothetical protein